MTLLINIYIYTFFLLDTVRWPRYDWGMSHVWMSHIWMRHVTHMTESCHTWRTPTLAMYPCICEICMCIYLTLALLFLFPPSPYPVLSPSCERVRSSSLWRCPRARACTHTQKQTHTRSHAQMLGQMWACVPSRTRECVPFTWLLLLVRATQSKTERADQQESDYESCRTYAWVMPHIWMSHFLSLSLSPPLSLSLSLSRVRSRSLALSLSRFLALALSCCPALCLSRMQSPSLSLSLFLSLSVSLSLFLSLSGSLPLSLGARCLSRSRARSLSLSRSLSLALYFARALSHSFSHTCFLAPHAPTCFLFRARARSLVSFICMTWHAWCNKKRQDKVLPCDVSLICVMHHSYVWRDMHDATRQDWMSCLVECNKTRLQDKTDKTAKQTRLQDRPDRKTDQIGRQTEDRQDRKTDKTARQDRQDSLVLLSCLASWNKTRQACLYTKTRITRHDTISCCRATCHSCVWGIIRMCDASLICVMHRSYEWCIIDMCDASFICVMRHWYVPCIIDMCDAFFGWVMRLIVERRHSGVAAVYDDASLIWPSCCCTWCVTNMAELVGRGARCVTRFVWGTTGHKRDLFAKKIVRHTKETYLHTKET